MCGFNICLDVVPVFKIILINDLNRFVYVKFNVLNDEKHYCFIEIQ